MKETIPRMPDTYKVMCQNCTGENKNRYSSIKIEAVYKAMSEKAEEASTELKIVQMECLHWLKSDGKEVDGGRCVRSNGKLYLSEKERGTIWKGYVERIMNEENYLGHNVDGDAVEGPAVCVCREEVVQVLTN